MSLSISNNKVFLFLMALAILLALVILATFVFDVSNMPAFSKSLYEIAGEATCSGCINSG